MTDPMRQQQLIRLRQLQDDMQSLMETTALRTPAGALRLTGVLVDTELFQDQSTLLQVIGACNGEGWVETSDGVQVLTPASPLPNLRGHLLSADLGCAEFSLRVRAVQRGWVCTRITEVAAEDPAATPALVGSAVHLGIRGPEDRLHYRLAYHLVDASLTPLDAWFIRFARSSH